jgi:hypothetical protein
MLNKIRGKRGGGYALLYSRIAQGAKRKRRKGKNKDRR